MNKIINNLSNKLKSKFLFNYDTSKNVWFRAGGKAKVYCIVYDKKELEIILRNIEGIPYEIIGAGSNILVRDNGYDGIIFKLGKNFNNIKINENCVEVGAGILDTNLAKYARINKIKNFEFYSGIPGSIGGAVKMNAGCYGSETKDVLKEINIIDSKGQFICLDKNNINLSYRNSNLNIGDIIVSANFNLSYGNEDEINHKIKNIQMMRKNTQPIKFKTSGSTFKNPINNFAAKLIEMSDCKGMYVGDAYVSKKHANFLINSKNASASQIEELGFKVIDKVYKKFNIKLEWEIRIIGN